MRAHNEAGYRRLGVAGRLVRPAARTAEVFAEYEDEFFAVLARRATVKRHVNVLQHAVGYLRDVVEEADRRALLDLIEDYRNSLVPLVVPITMLRHYVNRHHIEYLTGQLYLEPHPKELMLRNRV